MCIDMYTDMCIHVCVVMHMGMCMHQCMDKCMDMGMGMCRPEFGTAVCHHTCSTLMILPLTLT